MLESKERLSKELPIGILIKMLNTNIDKEFNKDNLEHNITKTQSDIMAYLEKNSKKEINQRDIEKQFNLSNPTVTGLLNRMEDKGLIKRTESQKGQNFKAIIITEKASKLLKTLKKNRKNFEQILTQDIEKEDIDKMKETLIKMIQNISR